MPDFASFVFNQYGLRRAGLASAGFATSDIGTPYALQRTEEFMSSKILTLTAFTAAWAISSLTIPATVGAQQAARMRFEAMDTNGDGRLSGDEIRIGAQRNANWNTADHDANRFERYVSWTAAGFRPRSRWTSPAPCTRRRSA